MRHLSLITRNDLRIFFSSRENWLNLLAMPILFTFIVGWAFDQGGPDLIRVDFIDVDQSDLSHSLASDLKTLNPRFALCPADNDDENRCRLDEGQSDLTIADAVERVQENDVSAAIIIPAGYGERVRNGERVDLDYYSDEAPTGIGPVRQALEAAVQRVNRSVTIGRVGLAVVDELEAADVESAPLFADAVARAAFGQALRATAEQRLFEQGKLVAFHVESSQESESAVTDDTITGFAQSVPGMGSMFVMFTVLGGMAVLLRERKQWTLQRLIVAPVSRGHVLAGKAGTYFLLGMIQYLVVFLFGLLLGQRMGGAPVALLAVMASFVLCIAGLTFALAPRMRSEEQASSLTTLIALILAPLGGAWWPLEITPWFMQAIGYLSPVAWAMDGFQTIIIRGGSLIDVLPQIGVLLAASVVLFVIGVRNFQTA